jgi:hypothetical protein
MADSSETYVPVRSKRSPTPDHCCPHKNTSPRARLHRRFRTFLRRSDPWTRATAGVPRVRGSATWRAAGGPLERENER